MSQEEDNGQRLFTYQASPNRPISIHFLSSRDRGCHFALLPAPFARPHTRKEHLLTWNCWWASGGANDILATILPTVISEYSIRAPSARAPCAMGERDVFETYLVTLVDTKN